MRRAIISLYYHKKYIGDFAIPLYITAAEAMTKFNEILLNKNIIDAATPLHQLSVLNLKKVERKIELDETIGEADVKESSVMIVR